MTASRRRYAGLTGRGVAAIAALGVGGGMMLATGGAAWATTDAPADPAAPVAAQSIVRPKDGQGVIRHSVKAVPGVRATPFGAMGTGDYVCRADWNDACD